MIEYFSELWKKFQHDPMFFRRCLRGFLFWLGALGGQLVPFLDKAGEWSRKDWVIRLSVAGLVGLAGMINLGEPNPKVKDDSVTDVQPN